MQNSSTTMQIFKFLPGKTPETPPHPGVNVRGVSRWAITRVNPGNIEWVLFVSRDEAMEKQKPSFLLWKGYKIAYSIIVFKHFCSIALRTSILNEAKRREGNICDRLWGSLRSIGPSLYLCSFNKIGHTSNFSRRKQQRHFFLRKFPKSHNFPGNDPRLLVLHRKSASWYVVVYGS